MMVRTITVLYLADKNGFLTWTIFWKLLNNWLIITAGKLALIDLHHKYYKQYLKDTPS